MKLYKAPTNEKEQMHLEVDHGLEPVEINEDDVFSIIEQTTRSNNQTIQITNLIMNLFK